MPENNPAPRVWSEYQNAVFDFVASGIGSAVVSAVAGSGKTTTIVEAMARIPAGKSSLFIAFNKSIAEELKARGVNARTYHSLCYGPVLRACGQAKVETDKLRSLIRAWPRDVASTYGNAAARLVGLARSMGIGCLAPDTDAEWVNLAERHEIEPDSEIGTEGGMVAAARRLMAECEASPLCDFDDLLYRAVARSIPLTRYDMVFVDEAQDAAPINVALLRKVLAAGGRVVAVGDRAQSIYAWRGADSSSMDNIRAAFKATELPLSVTYRCARSIVVYARQFADQIEAAPAAPEGTVRDLGTEWRPAQFESGDMVLCNVNAPLIKLAYRMIRDRLPFRMQGRDIGKGLVSLVKKLQPHGIDGLLEKLAAWQDRETEKARARDNDALCAAIEDKAESIRAIAESLPENSRTVPELCRTIEAMFDGSSGPVLSSIHRSKGLEASRVWWLNRDRMPAKWARKDWAQVEQRNLMYVAATRAKTELCLIADK